MQLLVTVKGFNDGVFRSVLLFFGLNPSFSILKRSHNISGAVSAPVFYSVGSRDWNFPLLVDPTE
jgi:hypothetical protein